MLALMVKCVAIAIACICPACQMDVSLSVVRLPSLFLYRLMVSSYHDLIPASIHLEYDSFTGHWIFYPNY